MLGLYGATGSLDLLGYRDTPASAIITVLGEICAAHAPDDTVRSHPTRCQASAATAMAFVRIAATRSAMHV
jgi:hypothetical protein